VGVLEMELVGRGERPAVKILQELMPSAVIETQVRLYKLLLPKYRTDLSERQLKETIDIVVKRKFKPVLCVRIQDRHHNSRGMGRIDKVQKYMLEWSYNKVLDIDELECPELFKDEVNVNSRNEIKKYMKPYL